ncbi:MAG: isocitrate lyase/phosphoenolpyruvate mutase family protein, partial [Robiginitomaculum sp.]|nr:isocitrate lyase/phosphoenolpyruvate mutase family protein [Robiginitomaculum sp.]
MDRIGGAIRFVVLIVAAWGAVAENSLAGNNRAAGLYTNEQWINALSARTGLDITNSVEVFRFVFSQLPKNVTVYPTENYYYFRFYHGGVEYAGNMRFAPGLRDEGKIYFIYFKATSEWLEEPNDNFVTIGPDHGVTIKKSKRLVYTVELDGKEVVDTAKMVQRLLAASGAKMDSSFCLIARSDSRAIEGLAKAIDRMKAYVGAGADVIFPEALKSKKEFETVRAALDIPILANMTEFGKSHLLNIRELEDLGINVVIYPVTTLRLAMGEVDRGLNALLKDGDQNAILDKMQHRKNLYELLRYKDYNKFDQNLFNFEVKNTPM